MSNCCIFFFFCMQDKVFQWLSLSYSSEGFYCTNWRSDGKGYRGRFFVQVNSFSITTQTHLSISPINYQILVSERMYDIRLLNCFWQAHGAVEVGFLSLNGIFFLVGNDHRDSIKNLDFSYCIVGFLIWELVGLHELLIIGIITTIFLQSWLGFVNIRVALFVCCGHSLPRILNVWDALWWPLLMPLLLFLYVPS